MKTYPIPMVPGPVKVPQQVLEAYLYDYGSGDLETEYLELYNQTEANLQTILSTRNPVAVMSGEGMLALWAALKSCIAPGDRVLSIASGVFGYGIADLARTVGAEVYTVGLPYNETINDWHTLEEAIAKFRPKMITVVHCETPSGTLNPLQRVGELKHKLEVPLLYVDAVASIGGAPVLVDEWGIDLALGGSQKVLSVPPGMSFVSVSEAAWEAVERVNYSGYDALKPFRTAQAQFYFPYTPYWHGTAALQAGCQLLLDEGLESVYQRHAQAADLCRKELKRIGLELYPGRAAIPSPTVTAVMVPEGWEWTALDQEFRKHGLVVGGSYGPLAGKVFRLGHMGTQADLELVKQAVDVIEKVVSA